MTISLSRPAYSRKRGGINTRPNLSGTASEALANTRRRNARARRSPIGNALTCALVRWLWGVRYTDLGPLRAIRRDALERLAMADPDYGWTIEMQVKAAQRGLEAIEVPVRYRNRRAGQSKVSGTVRGSWNAGRRILGYIVEARWRELRGSV